MNNLHPIQKYQLLQLSSCITPFRYLTTKTKNYYDLLGLNTDATVAEIKKAYYHLSMLYHPDKNEGSEEAATMFRDITEAYDVLTNIKKRRLYDKGVYGRGEPTTTTTQRKVDPQVKRTVTHYGRTPIYDFDSWSKQHYGSMFKRRQEKKAEFEDLERNKGMSKDQEKVERLLVFIIALVFLGMAVSEYTVTKNFDNPDIVNDKD